MVDTVTVGQHGYATEPAARLDDADEPDGVGSVGRRRRSVQIAGIGSPPWETDLPPDPDRAAAAPARSARCRSEPERGGPYVEGGSRVRSLERRVGAEDDLTRAPPAAGPGRVTGGGDTRGDSTTGASASHPARATATTASTGNARSARDAGTGNGGLYCQTAPVPTPNGLAGPAGPSGPTAPTVT